MGTQTPEGTRLWWVLVYPGAHDELVPGTWKTWKLEPVTTDTHLLYSDPSF